jgi:hypothetical protein
MLVWQVQDPEFKSQYIKKQANKKQKEEKSIMI